MIGVAWGVVEIEAVAESDPAKIQGEAHEMKRINDQEARRCLSGPRSLRSGPRKATIDGWPLMTSALESVMVGNHVPRLFD
jgi:hypothetical protein